MGEILRSELPAPYCHALQAWMIGALFALRCLAFDDHSTVIQRSVTLHIVLRAGTQNNPVLRGLPDDPDVHGVGHGTIPYRERCVSHYYSVVSSAQTSHPDVCWPKTCIRSNCLVLWQNHSLQTQ